MKIPPQGGPSNRLGYSIIYLTARARKFIARSLQTSMLSRYKRLQRIINPLRKSYRQRETDLIKLLSRFNISSTQFYYKISFARNNILQTISKYWGKEYCNIIKNELKNI